jgi:hypothetical protein
MTVLVIIAKELNWLIVLVGREELDHLKNVFFSAGHRGLTPVI